MTDDRERLVEEVAKAILSAEKMDGWTYRTMAHAALQAIEQSGFWLAPVTPTEEIIRAMEERIGPDSEDTLENVYAAMQSASRSSSRKG